MNLRASLILTLAAVAAASSAVFLAGCGAKEEQAPPQTWSSPTYRLTATYPGSWEMKELNSLEDPRTGETTIVLFRWLDDIDKTMDPRPPMVTITWIPKQQMPAPGPDLEGGVPQVEQGPMGIPVLQSGLTSGWTEFGATQIQTQEMTWQGAYQAEEATAVAEPGTAFFSTETGGQLVGLKQNVRVVRVETPGGYYQIKRVVPDKPEHLLRDADSIVNSVQITQ